MMITMAAVDNNNIHLTSQVSMIITLTMTMGPVAVHIDENSIYGMPAGHKSSLNHIFRVFRITKKGDIVIR